MFVQKIRTFNVDEIDTKLPKHFVPSKLSYKNILELRPMNCVKAEITYLPHPSYYLFHY